MTPDGWRVLRIGEIARVVSGIGFPREYQGNRVGPLPIFKVSDMNAPGNERELRVAANTVDAHVLSTLKGTAHPAGTVVFPKVGAALLTNKRRRLAVASAFDNNVMGLVPTACDPIYLYYRMQTIDFSNYVQQGAVPSVNGSTIGSIRVLVPTLPEQRKIAAILSSVDDAVEKTQAVIDEVQVVKRGLMQDLLTRGVAADGRVRPAQEKAPQLYKDSPLGWIPTTWETALLDDIATRGSGHTPNKKRADYWNGTVKWVSLADSWRLDRVHVSDTDRKITQAGIGGSSAVLHPAGIVVLSRDAGVGKSAITTCEMAVSQHFMCWKCGPRLNNYYLYYWLQYRKREFERIATGSTIPTIGLRFFQCYRLKVPVDIREQKIIAASLLAADQRILALENELQVRREVRLALMSVLLTGELRIIPDLETP